LYLVLRENRNNQVLKRKQKAFIMKKQIINLLSFTLIVLVLSCSDHKNPQSSNITKGKLFIIGGGKRPVEMLQSLIKTSGVDSAGYILVLPMSSEEPDTAAFYSKRQFTELGLQNVYSINFDSIDDMTDQRVDSVRKAQLIYISGGDQNRFMRIVKNTPVYAAIHDAYKNGSTIAGTSAGAAVMSKKMITGNELKYPEYTGEYRTIEANNIEIGEGLGLVDNIIVDQHFVKRMRMNRLISACIENPKEISIGIDEATAILVENDSISVYGISQVIVLQNKTGKGVSINGLLGAKGLQLDVLVPGDTYCIKK
jgi:cyanophycinase